MANQWFKFYGGEYLSDSKIGRLNEAERSCWITLLCMASMTDDGVIKFLSVDDLLTRSGIKWDPYNEGAWERCQGVLIKFSEMKMIKVDTEKSSIEILNWEKRQESPMSVTERVRKYRAKSREKLENVTDETKCNENVTLEEKRIEENRIDIYKYGEFKNVKLTDEEHAKLIEKMGERNTKVMIEKLSAYIASKGKRYSSHYATILNWARREVENYQKSKANTREIV